VLPDRAVEQARTAGVNVVAEPLGAAPEVVELIIERIAAPALVVSQ
jgi:hypothetical protein